MKCPKCQYISFDSGERCRNCGYEFSLTVEIEDLDLPMHTGDEVLGPLADFPLGERSDASARAASAPDSAPLRGAELSHAREAAAMAEASSAARASVTTRRHAGSLALPLFHDGDVPDDAPLVSPSAVPRVPLSVRRSTPALSRARSRDTEEPTLHLDVPKAERPRVRVRDQAAEHGGTIHGPDNAAAPDAPAGGLPRIGAAVIDVVIMGSITASVLYFTLQVTRLGFEQVHLLPPVPMAGFLLLLNAGYAVLFTAAGGQTIGKMTLRIRVVPTDPGGPTGRRVPLGHAVVRAAGYLVSLLPAGLGYLPAFIGQDRRAIHDRLADTRVIQA
ncbi:MAG: RDD family protein [Acidobacteria bacterium]|nr:RDD family protein [Acidobacteriota bacterium]